MKLKKWVFKNMSKVLVLIFMFLSWFLFKQLFTEWHNENIYLQSNFSQVNRKMSININNLNEKAYKLNEENLNNKDKKSVIKEIEGICKNIEFCCQCTEKWEFINKDFNFQYEISQLEFYIYDLEESVKKTEKVSEYDLKILEKLKSPLISNIASRGAELNKNRKGFKLYPSDELKEEYKKIGEISAKACRRLKNAN